MLGFVWEDSWSDALDGRCSDILERGVVELPGRAALGNFGPVIVIGGLTVFRKSLPGRCQ